MSRIKPVELPRLEGPIEAPAQVNLDVGAIMAHRPEISGGLAAFSSALVSGGTLSRRLCELIRLRIAFHNQCRNGMAIRYGEALDDGLTDGLVCSLESQTRPQISLTASARRPGTSQIICPRNSRTATAKCLRRGGNRSSSSAKDPRVETRCRSVRPIVQRGPHDSVPTIRIGDVSGTSRW
jgi:hypothetical protein